MITDTKSGQTNYRPNCEDQARRIEELERRYKMLADSVSAVLMSEMVGDYMIEEDWEPLYWNMYKALNATPSHSSAWEWNQHVEWMKKLPCYGWASDWDSNAGRLYPECDSLLGFEIPLVAIPELKEVE